MGVANSREEKAGKCVRGVVTLVEGICCARSRCSRTNLQCTRQTRALIRRGGGGAYIISAPRQMNAAELQYCDICRRAVGGGHRNGAQLELDCRAREQWAFTLTTPTPAKHKRAERNRRWRRRWTASTLGAVVWSDNGDNAACSGTSCGHKRFAAVRIEVDSKCVCVCVCVCVGQPQPTDESRVSRHGGG